MNACPTSRLISLAWLAFLLSLIFAAKTFAADPTTQPAPIPDTYIAKVALTPHFYQRNPRWDLRTAGENYCVPTATSNALIYFAENGFPNLLPDPDDKELAQIELIRTLASDQFMATNPNTGTSPSLFLFGLRKYVEKRGYKCARLEYAGWRRLRADQRSTQVANEPDFNWLKAAIANPNGAAILEIGHYVHGKTPNEWKRISGHAMLAIGYGTDGNQTNPNLFLVDNSAVEARVGIGPRVLSTIRQSRPLTLAEQSILFTRSGPMSVLPTPTAKPRDLPESYQVTGPGMPSLQTHTYDAAFLDGAVVLIIDK